MVTGEDVKKLAALARIEVREEELPAFTKEFEAILAYVGQLEELNLSKDLENKPALENVFRKDGESTPSGTWTEKLVAAFPQKEPYSAKATKGEGTYLVVKQIISHE